METVEASEGQQPAPPPQPPRARERASSFVKKRSRSQKLSLGVVVLLLATAPFGGLRAKADADTGVLREGEPIDTGPFTITIKNVVSLSDLAPAVSPQPGSRLLIIDLLVTNTSDRAEYAALVADALSAGGSQPVPWPDEDVVRPRLFDVSDAVEVPGGEFLNPGVSVEYAAVVQQRESFDPADFVLAVTGYTFQETDPLSLDDDRWLLDDTPAVKAHLDVEKKQ